MAVRVSRTSAVLPVRVSRAMSVVLVMAMSVVEGITETPKTDGEFKLFVLPITSVAGVVDAENDVVGETGIEGEAVTFSSQGGFVETVDEIEKDRGEENTSVIDGRMSITGGRVQSDSVEVEAPGMEKTDTMSVVETMSVVLVTSTPRTDGEVDDKRLLVLGTAEIVEVEKSGVVPYTVTVTVTGSQLYETELVEIVFKLESGVLKIAVVPVLMVNVGVMISPIIEVDVGEETGVVVYTAEETEAGVPEIKVPDIVQLEVLVEKEEAVPVATTITTDVTVVAYSIASVDVFVTSTPRTDGDVEETIGDEINPGVEVKAVGTEE